MLGLIELHIIESSKAPKLETVKGRHGIILITGEKAMMMKLIVEPGIPTPPHEHPHEQIGHLLEGKGVLTIGNESKEIEKGTSFCIPPNAPHYFNAIGDKPAVLIEAFSPPREDYLNRTQ